MSEPEIEPQLKELLDQIRSAPERSPDAMSRSRTQFFADLDTFFPVGDACQGVGETSTTGGRIAPRPSMHRLVFTRVAVALVILVCVFTGAFTTVRAAQAALPGDVLYPIKLNLEQAQVALTTDPARQSELHLSFAQNRLDEIDTLAGIGRYDDFADLATAFVTHMRMAAVTRDVVANSEPERASQLDDQIAQKLAHMQRTLNAVISAAPSNLQPELQSTLEAAIQASQPAGQDNSNENANTNGSGNANANNNANDNDNVNANSNTNTNSAAGANANENANTNANESTGNENSPVNKAVLAIDHFSIS